MGKTELNSECDINRVKYYLAVRKHGRECLEEAFYLFYNTWSRGKSYATLQEFCVECLGVKRDHLAELVCQPEILSPQGSARSSTTLPGRVYESERGTEDEERRRSHDAFHSFRLPSFSHVISPARRSIRRSQGEAADVASVPQDVPDATDPFTRQSCGEEKASTKRTSFHISEGQSQTSTHLTHTEAFSCVGQNTAQSENSGDGKPRGVRSSLFWRRTMRLLLPKPFLKRTVDSEMPLKRGSGSVKSPPTSLPSAQTTQPPAQEMETTSQVSCEDLKSFDGEESQDLNQVIQEAKSKLQSSFFLPDHDQKCFLHAEPDPRQMPLSVLVTLLAKVFPEVTPKIRHLLHRLQRLVYVVCYEDLVFDNRQLKFWLKKLDTVISELLAGVVSCCTAVSKRFVAEASEKLQTAKQGLQKALTEYKNHLEWVERTREEFEVVQKDLKEAQVKNSRVLRAYSRSCSQEADETYKTVPMKGRRNSYHFAVKRSKNAEDDGINRTDSGNLSLAEELEGQETRTELRNEDDILLSDSLLVSVMKEVALIEKRHNSCRPFDRKLKMMVRNAHKSVIVTKREMRVRLDSNVSAEEGAMSKEEVLSRRQMKTRVLSKEVKKLRRNLKDLQREEEAVVSRIRHDLSAVMEDELDEAVLREGRFGVEHLREGSGRLLRESRLEAKSFASRARIPDLGEWLMRQRYATTLTKQVYSHVRVADTRDSVPITDLVGTGHQRPRIIVLSGPKGSGKTCMAHYLLQQWEDNTEAVKSRIHEFDFVIYGKVSSVLSSGSWAQYLREHIFCLTLVDFPEARVSEALDNMSVLSLLEVDVINTSVIKILDDVFSNVENNKQVIVTTRCDGETDIVAAAKRHGIKYQRVRMCPMTPSAIQELSTSLVSLFEKDESVISSTAKKFSRIVSSMAVTEEVLYPLPITYLLYLWRANPRHALQATTVSRLVSQVIIVAESTLVQALKAAGQHEEAARAKAERCTEQLYEAAWRLVSGQGWPHEGHFLLESENISLTNPVEASSYNTLIMVKESADGKQRASFLHPSVAEILCGFFLTQQRLLHKGTPVLRRREKLEKYCVPEIKRYREVLLHMAGALVYNKHKLEDAKEIATLFFNSLTNKRDMIAWRGLLRECDFLSSMCAAVASVLSSYDSWTVANHSQEVNCALADLLKREAYRPQTIIISLERESGCKSECVIRALATCSSTLVHIRQESQFYAWGEPATCDALIMPLQPPGTLQECWGHVSVEGALALRHCHQLKELNVRVSSCEALNALTYSIAHIARGLRYLYLRVDLPTSTPVSDIEPLNFKGKSLWLRLRDVEDSSLDWVKQITRKLNGWYTELLLEKSNLSPSALHELKEFLPNTLVHISY